jgi:GrpB-like predicted nucleotidyltransferase (UPF0157 family)
VVGGSYDVFEKFLNLLRASPNLRGAYNDLKRAWIGQPMDAYRKAKAAFIASALEQDTALTAITPDRGHHR